MKQDISKWLASDRDYETGVSLYNHYGSSATLKTLFGHGSTNYTRTKLATALEALLDSNTDEPPVLAAPEQKRDISEHKTASFAPKEPEFDHKPLRDQMRPLLDERTHLHQRLSMHAELSLSLEERKQIAFRILDLTRQITPLYLQLHGAAPAPPAPATDFALLSGAELVMLRSNLRVQLSKMKKKPTRAAEIPPLELKIKQLTALIETTNV